MGGGGDFERIVVFFETQAQEIFSPFENVKTAGKKKQKKQGIKKKKELTKKFRKFGTINLGPSHLHVLVNRMRYITTGVLLKGIRFI